MHLLPFFLLLPTLTSAFSLSPHLSQLSARSDAQASESYKDEKLFEKTILNITNAYRAQHNASSLSWNTSLADAAEKVSEKCVFEHSGGPTGENLSSGYPNASASITAWGHERVDYDFKKGEFSHETGHFTQLVWKSTKSVGCARTECNGKSDSKRDDKGAPGWFVVCEYYPPGNVIGAFDVNVQAQLPEDEMPKDAPKDPEVPDNDEQDGKKEDCPQGGVCSGARMVRVASGAVIAAVVAVVIVGEWL